MRLECNEECLNGKEEELGLVKITYSRREREAERKGRSDIGNEYMYACAYKKEN